MIEVRTSARLHLGLLDNNGAMERLYGSIGLAVDRPELVLRARKGKGLRVEGPEKRRVAAYAGRFMRRCGFPAGAHLNLVSRIPAHVGLGSGTQLALAVGAALAALSGRRLSVPEIALAVGRGMHSGIGISTFQHGGFVLDGGHRVAKGPDGAAGLRNGLARAVERDHVPPVLFHRAVPGDWLFVVVIPKTRKGFNGSKERDAFLKLPRAPSRLVEKISRAVLIRMLPALVEKDAANFGKALTAIQCMVGDCFASVQGGRFANPVSEKMVDFMADHGAAGIGQSSWGPTVYGMIQGKAEARKLLGRTRACLETLGGGEAFLVRPQNRGARIKVMRYEKDPDPARQR
ncbi:MAG: kinase [Acidobacteria bacterium]|nr:kinase [Acidobacteriota bacterium]